RISTPQGPAQPAARSALRRPAAVPHPPAVVQQVASRSWSGIGPLPWRPGGAGPAPRAGWAQLGPGLGLGPADAVQETLGGGGPDGGVVGVDRGQRDLGEGGEEGG